MIFYWVFYKTLVFFLLVPKLACEALEKTFVNLVKHQKVSKYYGHDYRKKVGKNSTKSMCCEESLNIRMQSKKGKSDYIS